MKTTVIVLALIGGAALSLEPGAARAQDSIGVASGDTLKRIVRLPEIVVSTSRAGEKAPVARSVLGREDLLQRNWGQDTPMALATLPGAYAYSDAGNGIGYSYLSIRGFPQRRISVLINGVPLNDPESHEVYWIDHPDLLASTAEAQVQRGVGSALYGAASVGGSVNLETAPFIGIPRTSAAVGYGSFNTRRFMLEGDSGPLAGEWNLYGRYSRIETDGYRDKSDTRLWSYAFSARKRTGNHSLRVNLYGGPEETHLAYLGVPRPYLDGQITGDADRNRRFNPIQYDGERDHFFEPHYELVHSWSLAKSAALTQTLFYFDGDGFYDEQRFGRSLADYRLSPWATYDPTLFGADSLAYYQNDGTMLIRDAQDRVTVERFDLVRKRFVKNRHYGWVPRLRVEHPGGALTVGGEIRAHDGRHVGTVIGGSGLPPGTEPDHVYYDYHPRTLAAGLFLREEWRMRPELLATADVAWRHQGYMMRGDKFDGIRFDQPYDFALPRLGLTWTPWPNATLFAAAAHSRREPAFRDLYDAEGAGSVPLLKNGKPLIRPEKVNDYELGGSWWAQESGLSLYGVRLTANLFRMDFTDELVYAGQFNTDLGYPIIGNAARSVHQGIELAGGVGFGDQGAKHRRAEWGLEYRLGLRVDVDANLTLSDNHFVRYSEFYGPTPADEVKYDGNAIGFFPATLANASARLAWRAAYLTLEAQHAGRIYLDNTETKPASIEPRIVLNLSGRYRFRPIGQQWPRDQKCPTPELSFRVFNLLDKEYETGGYMDYDAFGNLVPHFIPAAKRHVLGELRVEW